MNITADEPNQLPISSLSTEHVSGNEYRITATCSTALDAIVAAGFPIGFQMVTGDNDASGFSGAYHVETVAIDRLSFTALAYFNQAPTDPTSITYQTINGVASSQILVPKAALIFQATGWGGADIEGAINAMHGARVTLSKLGLGYNANVAGSDPRDMLFARGNGSYMYLQDRCTVVGGGVNGKLLRQYGGAETHVNRSCIGTKDALEIWQGTTGGSCQIVRTSACGGTDAGFTSGPLTGLTIAQSYVGGCKTGIRNSSGISHVQVDTTKISLCERGIFAAGGDVSTKNVVELVSCNKAIDWQAGGKIQGPLTFTSNITDSPSPEGVIVKGGYWISDALSSPRDAGERVSIPNSGIYAAEFYGTGGAIKVVPETLPQLGMSANVDAAYAGTVAVQRYLGSEAIFSTNEVPVSVESGKVKYFFWEDAGVYRIAIANGDGGSRAFRVYTEGDIGLGAWAAYP